MRKAVTLLIIGAFCIVLFSPAISAMQWDPKHPPPYLQIGPDVPNGEEGSWVDPHKNNDPNYDIIENIIVYLSFNFIQIIYMPLNDQPKEKPIVNESHYTTNNNRN